MSKQRKRGWFTRLLLRLTGSCPCACRSCRGHGSEPCGCCDNTEPCNHEVLLADMRVGQHGRIVEVGGGDQDLVNRFADHGLVRGVDVTVHEQALFGGPLLVAVQGTMVALRLNEARLIRVCLSRATQPRTTTEA